MIFKERSHDFNRIFRTVFKNSDLKKYDLVYNDILGYFVNIFKSSKVKV